MFPQSRVCALCVLRLCLTAVQGSPSPVHADCCKLCTLIKECQLIDSGCDIFPKTRIENQSLDDYFLFRGMHVFRCFLLWLHLQLWSYSTTCGIEHCTSKSAENFGFFWFLNRPGFKTCKKVNYRKLSKCFRCFGLLCLILGKCSLPDFNDVNKELSCKAFERRGKISFPVSKKF